MFATYIFYVELSPLFFSGMDAAENLSPKGIHAILSAKEMCDPEVDHIGIMAYAAYFTTYKPVRSSEEKVIFSSLPQNVSLNQEVR